MKKLLIVTLSLFLSWMSYSQCVTDTNLINSYLQARSQTWGFMPDTVDNLPTATVNSLYNETIQVKWASTTNQLDSNATNVSINYLEIANVSGLPPGLTFINTTSFSDDFYCDGQGPDSLFCKWPGGKYGCFRIEGTPTMTGTYPLTITLNVNIPFAGTQTGDIVGFELVVSPFSCTNYSDTLFTTNSICKGDSLFFNNSYIKNAGKYYDSTNNNVCDSVIELTLIEIEYNDTVSVSACGSYTSVSGNVYNSNGVYTDTVTSILGCDSIVTVNLTLIKYYDTVYVNACDSSISPSGNYTYTATGIYNDTVSSVLGCDSIITIDLVVGEVYNTVTDSICAGDSIFIGNSYKYTSGTFYDTITLAGGCDSIIQINLFQASPLPNQINFEWIKKIGSNGDDFVTDMVTDKLGNMYLVGSFNYTVDFNPNAGTSNLTSNGGSDIYILKLDSGSNFIWAKSIGGASNDIANALSIDNIGNVYISGTFQNTVDFNPSGGYNLSSNGGNDIFILKLDSNGNFNWAKSFGGTSGNDNVSSLVYDKNGFIYTTGTYTGTVDFNPNAGVNNYTTNGGTDIFIQKLDLNGNFIWAKSFGGINNDYSKGVDVDSYGNVYTTGYFSDNVDFNPNPGIYNATSNGGYDFFIQKLDVNGDFVWTNTTGGVQNDFSNSLTIDGLNNIYTIGTFRGVVDFDAGTMVNNLDSYSVSAMFINKIDINGNHIWTKQIGDSNSVGAIEPRSIKADLLGNIIMTGRLPEFSKYDFDPGVAQKNLLAQLGDNVFMVKLDPSGVAKWISSLIGAGQNNGSNRGVAIAVNPFNEFLISGDFTYNLSKDYSSPSFFSSSGGYDIFINKLSNSNSIMIAYDTICEGDSLLYNGTYFKNTGTYSMNTCSGSSMLILEVIPRYITLNTIICNGDSLFFDGNYIKTSGTYYDTITSAIYCDSIIELNLTVNNQYSSLISLNIASGTTYTSVGGNIYNSSGNYYDTLTSVGGCDSIIEYNLNFISLQCSGLIKIDSISTNYYLLSVNDSNKNSYDSINWEIVSPSNVFNVLSGDSVFVNFYDSGIHHITLSYNIDTILGASCSINDSIYMTSTYQVCYVPAFFTIYDTACQVYTTPGGNSYYNSGIYYDTAISSTSPSGCDTIYTYDLTITPGAGGAYFYFNQNTPNTIELVDSSYGTDLSYKWSWGDGSYDSAVTTPTHTYSNTGLYEVCLELTDTINGCKYYYCDSLDIDSNGLMRSSFTINVVKYGATGLSETITEVNINLYPNPAKNELWIESENEMEGYEILSVSGQLIERANLTGNKSQINISSIANGYYLIGIKTNRGVVYKKIGISK